MPKYWQYTCSIISCLVNTLAQTLNSLTFSSNSIKTIASPPLQLCAHTFYSRSSSAGWTHRTHKPSRSGEYSAPPQHSRWVVALPVAGADPTAARSGAGAELRPGAPTPIVALRLLAGSPDAVALEAPLKSSHRQEERSKKPRLKDGDIWKHRDFLLLPFIRELHDAITAHEYIRVQDVSYLSWCALRPVHRRTFFGLTKVLVVGVAAPQLLAGVVGPKLYKQV